MARRIEVDPMFPKLPMKLTADIGCGQDQTPARLKDTMALQQHTNWIGKVLDHVTHHDRIELLCCIVLANQRPEVDIESSTASKFDAGGIKIYSFSVPSPVLSSADKIAVATAQIQQPARLTCRQIGNQGWKYKTGQTLESLENQAQFVPLRAGPGKATELHKPSQPSRKIGFRLRMFRSSLVGIVRLIQLAQVRFHRARIQPHQLTLGIAATLDVPNTGRIEHPVCQSFIQMRPRLSAQIKAWSRSRSNAPGLHAFYWHSRYSATVCCPHFSHVYSAATFFAKLDHFPA